MAAWTLSFGLALLLVFSLPTLPGAGWLLLIPPALISAWVLRQSRPFLSLIITGFVAGSLLGVWEAKLRLDDRLAPTHRLEVNVKGQVIGLPERRATGTRFQFQPDTSHGLPGLIRLSWREAPAELQPDSRLSLRVRLRSPHGFRNPHLFDYERWLFQQGIGATGYVREGQLLATGERSLDKLRWSLAGSIRGALGEGDGAALIQALSVGYRGDLRPELRRQFQDAGTAHLIAISGLHVAMVSGLVFLLVVRGLKPRWLDWTPMHWAAVLSILAAGAYAALAGFALPTLRAWVMLSVVLGAVLARRRINWNRGLLLALAVVLMLMPLSVLDAGFWLSFGAVLSLIYSGSADNSRGYFQRLLISQAVLFVGLFPLLSFWFGAVPLWSPLMNLIAIPLVGAVCVPLSLLGLGLQALGEPLGVSLGLPLLVVAAWVLEWFADAQAWLLGEADITWSIAAAPIWAYLLAATGALLLFSPMAWKLRLLGLGFGLPLILGVANRPPVLAITVMDVGQGQAVLLQTANHALVYDMGPRYRSGFDTGAAIVLPLMRALGENNPDILLASHDDLDHAGGSKALRKAFEDAVFMAPGPIEGKAPDRHCRSGQSWRWDGVHLEVLHPPTGLSANDNNMSCVLKVGWKDHAVLLTGDIEASVERDLVRTMPMKLAADLMLAPHHGSRSSSSIEFIDAVSPRWVLISAGWGNRWSMPHDEVLMRYREKGLSPYVTADSGAISASLNDTGEWRIREERERRRYLWSSP
ncbi:MAG: DNA internalization-related competence protein ComEC/Rec2 [Gammaproteobacteria bacterium]